MRKNPTKGCRVTKSEAIAKAREMIAAYEAAELAVLQAQSYTIKGRTLTRAHLGEIKAGKREWQRKLSALQSGRSCGLRTCQVVPKW